MRSIVRFMLMTLLVPTTLLGAPRESASFTNVPSASSVQGSAQPEQGSTERTTTLAGGYTARRLVITGTLQSQVAVGQVSPATPLGRQTRVLVTPPGGRPPFVVFPFPRQHEYTTLSTPAAGVSTDLLDPGFDPAGVWRFRFFQSFQNRPAGQPDAVWTSVSFRLDDAPLAPPAAPAEPAAAEEVVFTNVPSDGIFNSASAPNAVREWTWTGTSNSAPYQSAAIIISGQLRSLQADNQWQNAGLAIRPPGADRDIFVQPFFTSSAQRGFGVMNLDAAVVLTFPQARSSAGVWRVRAFQYQDLAGLVDATWTSLRIAAIPLGAGAPPAGVDLGTLAAPLTRSGDALAAGGVLWKRFTLPAGARLGDRSFLDIDFEGTTLTPSFFGTDMAAALYSADGVPLAVNNAGGTDSRALLSFGAGLRAAPGAGALALGGQDGDLPPGTYHLAVACWSPTLTFAPGFAVLGHASPQSGTVRTRLAPGLAATIPTPVPARDLGVIDGPQAQTLTLSGQPTTWLRLVLPAATGIYAPSRWLDVDTRGSSLPAPADTVLALFDHLGRLMAVGDDGAGDLLSLLTFGGTPGRAAIGTGWFRNGAGGDLHRGVYYLAAATATSSGPAFGHGFGVLGAVGSSGTLVVNVTTNLRAGDAADVASVGGAPTPDGARTADDVIVFLGALVAGDAAVADIASLGGAPEPDGVVTTDDLIAFLAAFFAG